MSVRIQERLTAEASLPRDASDALLVGRVFVPALDGPVLVREHGRIVAFVSSSNAAEESSACGACHDFAFPDDTQRYAPGDALQRTLHEWQDSRAGDDGGQVSGKQEQRLLPSAPDGAGEERELARDDRDTTPVQPALAGEDRLVDPGALHDHRPRARDPIRSRGP